MKWTIRLLLLSLVLYPRCAFTANDFMLTDPVTGETFGPFAYSNNAPVRVADRDLVLTRSHSAAAAMEEKMRRIIIPNIEFRQAALADVLRFLVDAVEELPADQSSDRQ